MQFNTIWLVLAELLGQTGEGWWLSFWYRWVVYLAFGYTVLLLFLILLRNILPSASARDQHLANTITWITSLSLLLIIPSLLVRLLPGFLLRLAGLAQLNSLQMLSNDNLQYLLAIVRHLSWQGTLGFAFVLAASAHPSTRQLIFRGRVQPPPPAGQLFQPAAPVAMPAKPLPEVYLSDELTPMPGALLPASPGALEPSPVINRVAADEITLIPSPPLPLAAWLRSLVYKGGSNQIFELTVAETDIGRQVGHVTLEADLSISSQHAAIRYQDNAFYLEDRSRYHSTWLNGVQAKPGEKMPLRDGDTVRFGESKFQFNILRWPDIEFANGNRQGQILRDQPLPVLIGSGDHNHIVITGNGILETHARLELDFHSKRLALRPESHIAPDSVQVLTGNGEAAQLGEPPWLLPVDGVVVIGAQAFRIKISGESL